jgi:hypothetical protein
MCRLEVVVRTGNLSYKLTTLSRSSSHLKIVRRMIPRPTRQQLQAIIRTINGWLERHHLHLMEVKKSYNSLRDLILLEELLQAITIGTLMLLRQAFNRTLITRIELTSQHKTLVLTTVQQVFKALTKPEEVIQPMKPSLREIMSSAYPVEAQPNELLKKSWTTLSLTWLVKSTRLMRRS